MMRSMGDDSLIPISDEQAKLGQELVKTVRDGSGYFTDILGDIPKDLIGLRGSREGETHREDCGALARTRERLRDRGIDPEPPSLKYAIPILQAAADEENDELQDLWSRLLAAAMDPSRRDAMRQSFITAVKQMDPMDTLVLKAVRDSRGLWGQAARDAIAKLLLVSIDHLAELACIAGNFEQLRMQPFGTLLMNVVSG